MSVYVTSWVWDNATTIGGNDLLVLLAIADNTDDTGANAWPSVATLARKTRLNERTVQRITRRLAQDGHLIVEATTGGRRSNRYRIPMTQPAAAPPPPVQPPIDEVDPGSPTQTRPAPGYPQRHDAYPQPPAARHPGGPPPRHDATAPPAGAPPLPRRNRATRTSLTHPRTTPRADRRPGGPAAPPDRCARHLGQSAHNCGPCRSELVGAE
ncbi:helix-turn-helix domain-containing protein [Actinoplanes sp. NPDC026623]|uniref:helix-turn-helix domain-containing protein n=1 Tax=Actinoplanes sp. NPDC026623 TaxID=3155610 RepID=UPI0033F664BD